MDDDPWGDGSAHAMPTFGRAPSFDLNGSSGSALKVNGDDDDADGNIGDALPSFGRSSSYASPFGASSASGADFGGDSLGWRRESDGDGGGWGGATDDYVLPAHHEATTSAFSFGDDTYGSDKALDGTTHAVDRIDIGANDDDHLDTDSWPPPQPQTEVELPSTSHYEATEVEEDNATQPTEEKDWGGFGQSPTLPPIRDGDDDNDDVVAADAASPTGSLNPEGGWTAEWEPEEAPPPLPSFGDVFTKAKALPQPAPVGASPENEKASWSPVDVKPSWEPDTLDIEASRTGQQQQGDGSWAEQPSQGLVRGKSIPAALVDELKVKSRHFASDTWDVPESTWGTAGFQESLSASLLDTVSEPPSLPSTSAVTLETPLSSLFKQSTTLYPAYRQGIQKTAASAAETLTGGQSRTLRSGGKFAIRGSALGPVPLDLTSSSATARSGTTRSATPPISGRSTSPAPRLSSEESPQQGALGRLFGRFRRPAANVSTVPGPTAAAVMGVPYDDPSDTSAPTKSSPEMSKDPFSVFDRPAQRAPQPAAGGTSDPLDDFFASPVSTPAARQTSNDDFDLLGERQKPIVRQELPRNTNSLDPFDPLVSDNTPFNRPSIRSAAPPELAAVASFHQPQQQQHQQQGQASEPAKDEFDDFFDSFSSAPARPSATRSMTPVLTPKLTSPPRKSVLPPVRTSTPTPPPVSPSRVQAQMSTTGSSASTNAAVPRLAPPPPPGTGAGINRSGSPLSMSLSNPTSAGASASLAPPPPPGSQVQSSLSSSQPASRSTSPFAFDSKAAPLVPSPVGSTNKLQSQQQQRPQQQQQQQPKTNGTGALTLDDLSFFEN